MSVEEDTKDLIIVGGGILGLMCAMEAWRKFPYWEIAILESDTQLFSQQSGNNSGVLHSAIHCHPRSLKAKLSKIGKSRILGMCKMLDVPVKKSGMMIVASNKNMSGILKEAGSISWLLWNARQSKIPIEFLSHWQIKEMEPNVSAMCGLWLPDIWIIDPLVLGRELSHRLYENGILFHKRNAVTDIVRHGEIWRILCGECEYFSRAIINAAGVSADEIARMVGIASHRIILVRGEYYEVLGEWRDLLDNVLIYPAIHGKSKGVHLMRTPSGQFKIGPNAKPWRHKYDIPSVQTPIEEFLDGAGGFMPKLLDIPKSCFRWSNAGIRAESRSGDIVVSRDIVSPPLVTCFSASPGLSASPAIAEMAISLL